MTNRHSFKRLFGRGCALALCAAGFSGCELTSEEPPPPTPVTNYVTLESPRASIHAVTYDPEAMFLTNANSTFPPEANPPASLFNGSPWLVRSAIEGALVDVESVDTGATWAAEGPSGPDAVTHTYNVPTKGHSAFNLRTTPPATVTLGGNLDFYPEAVFGPVPPSGTYYPTTTLKPIRLDKASVCYQQSGHLMGNQGALAAVAAARSTSVQNLLSTTGGVAFVWAHPSINQEMIFLPAAGSQLQASAGQVYAISFPGSGTPYGFAAALGNTSDIGYFAVVLPSGAPGNVTITVTDPAGEATYPVMDVVVPQGRPSVLRVFSNEAPPIPFDLPDLEWTWVCKE